MGSEAKTVKDSRSVITDIILPGQTNYHGTVFGGQLLQSVDKIATITAMRHCNLGVVTASCEAQFLYPVEIGETIEMTASVIWTHRSSMEIHVVGQVENIHTSVKQEALIAFLTFVGLDENNKSTQVPAVIPETDQEKRLFELGEKRYHERKRKRAEMKTK